MNFWDLFFGFEGRIDRKSWWIGSAILITASIVGAYVFNPRLFDFSTLDPAPPTLPDTLFALALLIPTTAVNLKRFNDRGWPEWLPYAISILTCAMFVGPHYGYLHDPMKFSMAETLYFNFILALLVAVIIDNGFMPGRTGSSGTDAEPRLGPAPDPRAG